MSDLLLLSARQMARISGFFPLSHGVLWVDDRRVVSGDGRQDRKDPRLWRSNKPTNAKRGVNPLTI